MSDCNKIATLHDTDNSLIAKIELSDYYFPTFLGVGEALYVHLGMGEYRFYDSSFRHLPIERIQAKTHRDYPSHS